MRQVARRDLAIVRQADGDAVMGSLDVNLDTGLTRAVAQSVVEDDSDQFADDEAMAGQSDGLVGDQYGARISLAFSDQLFGETKTVLVYAFLHQKEDSTKILNRII